MTREEALVKIGSAVTLINDVAENFVDNIGRMNSSISKEQLYATPMEKMIISGSKILTEAIKFLKCEDIHEYLRTSVDLMLETMGKLERREEDGDAV